MALHSIVVAMLWETNNPSTCDQFANGLCAYIDFKVFFPSTADITAAVNTKKDDEQISKYRELLRTIQGKEEKTKDMEMEITWVPGK